MNPCSNLTGSPRILKYFIRHCCCWRLLLERVLNIRSVCPSSIGGANPWLAHRAHWQRCVQSAKARVVVHTIACHERSARTRSSDGLESLCVGMLVLHGLEQQGLQIQGYDWFRGGGQHSNHPLGWLKGVDIELIGIHWPGACCSSWAWINRGTSGRSTHQLGATTQSAPEMQTAWCCARCVGHMVGPEGSSVRGATRRNCA